MRLGIVPRGLERWKTSSETMAAVGKNENPSQWDLRTLREKGQQDWNSSVGFSGDLSLLPK